MAKTSTDDSNGISRRGFCVGVAASSVLVSPLASAMVSSIDESQDVNRDIVIETTMGDVSSITSSPQFDSLYSHADAIEVVRHKIALEKAGDLAPDWPVTLRTEGEEISLRISNGEFKFEIQLCHFGSSDRLTRSANAGVELNDGVATGGFPSRSDFEYPLRYTWIEALVDNIDELAVRADSDPKFKDQLAMTLVDRVVGEFVAPGSDELKYGK